MQLFVADRGQNDAWSLVGSKIESGSILLTAVRKPKRYIRIEFQSTNLLEHDSDRSQPLTAVSKTKFLEHALSYTIVRHVNDLHIPFPFPLFCFHPSTYFVFTFRTYSVPIHLYFLMFESGVNENSHVSSRRTFKDTARRWPQSR